MALKFSCRACGEDIIVRYLGIGEMAKCKHCGVMNEVPESALEIAEMPEPPRASSESKEGSELAIEAETHPLKEVAKESMAKHFRRWGTGMIVLGVIHLILSKFLDPVWGGIIIVLGIVNLIVHRRGMFILNGIMLIFVGLMNMISSLFTKELPWIILGALQITWGIGEARNYRRYGLKTKS